MAESPANSQLWFCSICGAVKVLNADTKTWADGTKDYEKGPVVRCESCNNRTRWEKVNG